MRPIARVVLSLLAVAAPAAAQAPDPARVTLERIFARHEFASEPLGPTRWIDGDAYTTLARDGERGVDLVRVDAATGAREVLVRAADLVPPGAEEPLAIEDYAWSPDRRRLLVFANTRKVWRQNTRGDYWVLDRSTRRLTRLGGDAPGSTLMFAKFDPAGERVGYVRWDENDLYVEDLADGTITRLTDDGSRTTINGTFDWVYEEEFDDRDGWRWSPDGSRIAYWQLDAEGVRDFLLLNATDSLYSYTIPVQYPKAGTTNSAARVGVVDADGGPTTWMRFEGDPREHYLPRMEWAAGPDEIVLQRLDRLQQTLVVALGHAATGAVRTVRTETEPEGWVDVRVETSALEWIDGGRSFVWASEADGWRRLWVVPREGGEARPITPAGEDVIEVVAVHPEGGVVDYLASPDDATRRYLWRARLDGAGDPVRLTPADQPGVHAYDVAPGGHWAIHTRSAFGEPPVTMLVRLPSHETVRTLVDDAALRRTVAALDRGPVEFFRVDADGVPLDGWIMKPPDFDPSRRYPILFHVYAEPAGQTVLDEWTGAEWAWHLMLTQRGWLVASLDPRGTPAPRGKAWRQAIYGRIGTLTARDLAAGARAVLERPYVDPERVAIWGWSGGGSQTLNALFRHPDLFRLGMAVAPVPDLRLYDTIYQERYMGLPQERPDDYAASSPLTHAAGLEGDLLVIHGTGDDNVHWQGTQRLVNALVAAGKPFTMMAYPNRTHCVCEGAGTTLHLYGLLTRFLEERMPAGGGVAAR